MKAIFYLIFKLRTYSYGKLSFLKMSQFIMKVHPVVGKVEWVKNPAYYDHYQEIARSSYGDMLHDTERNRKYYASIKKAIHSLKSQGRTVKVLDIGTGTGLLSMMAARTGVDSITACEAFSPVAKCAAEVIKQNGLEDKINIIPKHSTELKVGPDGDMKEKANLLVSEVFDTELIGEGALKTFHHAITHLLEPDCIVVPSAATVYAQIIDSPLISSWNSLAPIHVSCDEWIFPPKLMAACKGSAAVHDVQMSQLPADRFSAITDPISVFEFSFCGKKSIEVNETFIKQVPAIRSGNCEVVFMWWELKMDMDGDIILNNGPKWVQPDPEKAQWRDHWMQAIYYLPDSLSVMKGEKIIFTAYHDEYSLWFDIPKANKKPSESPTCSCSAHTIDSHARIGMKNDKARNAAYVSMLKQVISSDSVCATVSDGSLLPLMAAKLGAKQVFAFEHHSLHHNMIKSYVQENDKNNVVKLLEKQPFDVGEGDLDNQKINVLVAEPYFINSVRPWEIMRLLFAKFCLKSHLAPDATVLPQCGKLRAVAVDFDDLWKIRAPVQSAEGFDLSKFDEIIQRAIKIADAAVEPHPLWEYPCRALSDVSQLVELNFAEDPQSNNYELQGDIAISSEGTCNAVALWTDYSFRNVEINNGPVNPVTPNQYIQWYMNSLQGVYFIHPPISVIPEKHVLRYKLCISMSKPEITFTIDET